MNNMAASSFNKINDTYAADWTSMTRSDQASDRRDEDTDGTREGDIAA
ncbi:hypothetical protein [Paenibacillus sp. BC26]|nr:hypothetical protein [Paenibacillus sp. BC26]